VTTCFPCAVQIYPPLEFLLRPHTPSLPLSLSLSLSVSFSLPAPLRFIIMFLSKLHLYAAELRPARTEF